VDGAIRACGYGPVLDAVSDARRDPPRFKNGSPMPAGTVAAWSKLPFGNGAPAALHATLDTAYALMPGAPSRPASSPPRPAADL